MDIPTNADTITQQATLHQLEALCTQEEPPACTAACPLHLDVRTFIVHVKKGAVSDAYKLYSKAIPFAGIIAHCCNAPCEGVCLRKDLGGTVQIRHLEQAVYTLAKSAKKPPMLLPKKSQKAAIIGGGLRGLTAALDLAKKGYKITIYEAADKLGGVLNELSSSVLPQEVLDKEIESLLAYPVQVVYNRKVDCDTQEKIQDFIKEEQPDVLYLACSSALADTADPESLVTKMENVVAGHRGGRIRDGHSPIYDVYDGRSAASTMDRLLQKVSLMAGRQGEGSFETTLFTNTENIAPVDGTPLPEDGPDEPWAVAEAGRCIQCECLECVKKCGFMQKYKTYPRRYVREVYNNLSIAMGTRHANKMINTCAECSQCEAICPNGLDMADVFLAARDLMVKTDKMPPSAHEFAMLDMDYSLSESSFLAKLQPGREQVAYVFFPGCQLSASEPAMVRSVYEDLIERVPEGVGLMLGCCGVMAHWAGEKALFDKTIEQLRQEWEKLGKPVIITGCPSCLKTLKELAGFEVMSMGEILSEIGLPEYNELTIKEMSLHHACGARYNDTVQRQMTALAADLGVVLSEQGPKQDQDPCCGYGGLVPFVDSEIADTITEVGAREFDKPILTYCVNCRDRYLKQGYESYHILELLYNRQGELQHRYPTWSERQENRAALKKTLLADLWQETPQEEKVKKIDIVLEPGLDEKLEESHILHSDIKNTIICAEENDKKLVDQENGHFIACWRPQNVTFWVEYARDGEKFRVFNAYSHRMLAQITSQIGGIEVPDE